MALSLSCFLTQETKKWVKLSQHLIILYMEITGLAKAELSGGSISPHPCQLIHLNLSWGRSSLISSPPQL